MNDHLVVINTGSATLKYAFFDCTAGAAPVRRGGGSVERSPGDDHPVGQVIAEVGRLPGRLVGVAHRVVHGGAELTRPVVVDDRVTTVIDALAVLAPLHNPANLDGVVRMRAAFPAVPQVVVFDTAFHATLPEQAWRYALPPDVADPLHVRRFGFHGTSCSSVLRATAEHLRRSADQLDLVVVHVGGGVSVTAIHEGRSVDTTMGMTPTEGAVMGTRCGDLDPAAVLALVERGGRSPADVLELLTRRSGLIGMAGSADLREVRARADAGDETCRVAVAVYAHRLRRCVGAMLAQLPGLDAVVFTGGVGEHDARLRHEVLAPLAHLGIRVDATRNANTNGSSRAATISPAGEAVQVLVMPADEEREIARQAWELLSE